MIMRLALGCTTATRRSAFSLGLLTLTAVAVVVSVSLLATAPAQASPGGLDQSFSGDGMQITDFAGSGDGASDVAIQADGKIVVVGGSDARAGGAPDFALVRYTVGGSLDQTFSGDGTQLTDFGGGSDAAADVAVQPDGRIVVVGSAGGNFGLARYNTEGSLDTSFDGDGKQTTDFGGGSAHGVALQADGKIVAVGYSAQGSRWPATTPTARSMPRSTATACRRRTSAWRVMGRQVLRSWATARS